MSKESISWLNENTLIGFTDKRGNAWHYRQGSDNHFAGPVPVELVESRLFDWEAEEHPLYAETDRNTFAHIPGRKAILRSDNGYVMGIFKEGYQPHQYRQWLLENVATLLDDQLQIGSAGLLRGGAVAWVSVEVPDTITTPEGVRFRPNLLACTSFDGSIATTYKRVVTNVVCDNTMAAGLSESGQEFRVKHSANSLKRIADARDALGIVYSAADDFASEVKRLCQVEVSDKTWDRVLEAVAPMPAPPEGKTEPSPRAVTMTEAKRDELSRLWRKDPMVSPWQGTAFGVWQAVSTYGHHKSIVRGMGRPERNMLRAVDGTAEALDAEAMHKVMALV